MENRFKKLRYYDDLCLHKRFTMDELADELLISKATISHLETSEDYDARISILKEYKRIFPEVSYDYLLGAKNTKSNEYSNLEHTLPLGDKFYETLQNLFRYDADYESEDISPEVRQSLYEYETEMHKRIENMLECMFSDSSSLFYFLLDTYNSLLNLYLLENPVNKKDTLDSDYLNESLSFEWYKLTQTTQNFFKNIVFKNMQPVFEAERDSAIKRKKEVEDYKKKQKEQYRSQITQGELPF